MLFGQFEHSIDVKGRLSFPARFRDDLGDTFIVVKWLDNCLAAFSMEEWENQNEKLKNQPSKARTIQRFFFSSAVPVETDKQGRIIIPANLREYAGLEKDVVIAGVSNRAEIWDKQKWDELSGEITPEMIAEALDSFNL